MAIAKRQLFGWSEAEAVGRGIADLIIPAEFFDNERIELLLETIRSEEFSRRVRALGGYDTRRTGEVVL